MNVNLSILYTHTPWGCLMEMKMYDILLLVEVTASSADRSQSNVSICNIWGPFCLLDVTDRDRPSAVNSNISICNIWTGF